MRNTTTTATCLLLAIAALCAPLAAAGDKACTVELETCVGQMIAKLRHRGWVGIEFDMKEDGKGMVITRVVPESPAVEAGVQAGDTVIAMNDIPYELDHKKDLEKVYHKMVPGNTITYTLIRDGETLEVPIVLGTLPEELIQKWIGYHVMNHHAQTEIAESEEEAAETDGD